MHADTTTTVAEGDIIPAEAPLDATLETHAQMYLDARRRAGQGLLDAAHAVSLARKEARHGQWGPWLDRVGLSADTAENLIAIHAKAQEHKLLAEKIRAGFLSLSVAVEVARDENPQALLERLLAYELPPTKAQARAERRAAKSEPARDLPPSPSVLPDLRSALIRLDAHAAQPLLYGISPGALRNEWRDDIELVREIADCVHRLDRDGAHRVAVRIHDRELRETMLRAYPAPAAPAPEADAVPPPADPYAPIRSAVLAGPHRWPAARKLIAKLDGPAKQAWDRDLLSVQAIDQDLRNRQTGRLDNLIASISDPALAEAQQVITAGACRELGLAWPAPATTSAPPADAAAVLAALERRAAAVGAKLLIYGENVQLVEAGGKTTRYPDGDEAALEARIAELEVATPAARGIAPHCPPEKVPADWDAWRARAKAAGGDLALSQMGIATLTLGGRVAGRAYPHEPEQWPALCEKIADALPAQQPAQLAPADDPAEVLYERAEKILARALGKLDEEEMHLVAALLDEEYGGGEPGEVLWELLTITARQNPQILEWAFGGEQQARAA